MNKQSNAYKFFKYNPNTIERILHTCEDYEGWSLQGFGMLRLYLTPNIRLHIWDSTFAVPNVSLIHDHPWDFESYIVCGSIRNTRFIAGGTGAGEDYHYATIHCGPGGGIKTEPTSVKLNAVTHEVYVPASTYRQEATEIHESRPDDGTITLVERTFKSDTEHARVFWPAGTDWVSAEPRKATISEVQAFCNKALEKYFV